MIVCVCANEQNVCSVAAVWHCHRARTLWVGQVLDAIFVVFFSFFFFGVRIKLLCAYNSYIAYKTRTNRHQASSIPAVDANNVDGARGQHRAEHEESHHRPHTHRDTHAHRTRIKQVWKNIEEEKSYRNKEFRRTRDNAFPRDLLAVFRLYCGLNREWWTDAALGCGMI